MMIGGELGLHCVILLCVLVCWSTCGHAIMEVQPIRTALSATLQPIINHNGGGANKSDCILCQDGNEANCVRPWFIHMHMDKVRSQFLFNVSEENNITATFYMDPCMAVNTSRVDTKRCPPDSALCICLNSEGGFDHCYAPANRKTIQWSDVYYGRQAKQKFGDNVTVLYHCNKSTQAYGIGIPTLNDTVSPHCKSIDPVNKTAEHICLSWASNFVCNPFPSINTSSFTTGASECCQVTDDGKLMKCVIKADNDLTVDIHVKDQFNNLTSLDGLNLGIVNGTNCSEGILVQAAKFTQKGQYQVPIHIVKEPFAFSGIRCQVNFSLCEVNSTGNCSVPSDFTENVFGHVLIVIKPNPSSSSSSSKFAIIIGCGIGFVVVIFVTRWYYKYRKRTASVWKFDKMEAVGRRGFLHKDGRYSPPARPLESFDNRTSTDSDPYYGSFG